MSPPLPPIKEPVRGGSPRQVHIMEKVGSPRTVQLQMKQSFRLRRLKRDSTGSENMEEKFIEQWGDEEGEQLSR